MFNAFAVIQIIICVLLVVVILLQEGKKGMGAIFGGSSNSAFGARGAGNLLTKITTVLAVLFMLNSVWLSYISSSNRSVVDTVKVQQTAPAEQAAPTVVVEEKKPAEEQAPAEEKPAEQAPAEQNPAE
jgi:preprotein translocase subunit SecG